METITIIIEIISTYVRSLDWSFIMTYILLCYGINHFKVKGGLQKSTGLLLRTRYKVVLVGLLYGSALFFIRGCLLSSIESLFQSLVFGLVFHKVILESLFYWLARHGLPESIARHFLSEEQLNKLKP